MAILQSIILGLIQGLTEFFPVSSSGHLIVLSWLFGWKEHPLAFDVILHAATFCAITIYFRKEWLGIFGKAFLIFSDKTAIGANCNNLFWNIIIASVPGIIFGAIFAGKAEEYFRNPLLISVTLGIFGLVLYFAETYGRKNKNTDDITWQIAFLIGLSQALAFLPGVSRSGITISAALALGMNRESSVKFSFFLAAPVIFAATGYYVIKLFKLGNFISYSALAAGFTAAFISGIIAIHFLLKLIRRKSFTIFVVYRLIFSLVIILILFTRR